MAPQSRETLAPLLVTVCFRLLGVCCYLSLVRLIWICSCDFSNAWQVPKGWLAHRSRLSVARAVKNIEDGMKALEDKIASGDLRYKDVAEYKEVLAANEAAEEVFAGTGDAPMRLLVRACPPPC